MLRSLIRLSILVLLVHLSQSYKILVLPIAGKSHVFSMTVIAEELARRGNNVTMVLPDYFQFPAGKEPDGINLEKILRAEGEVAVDYETLEEDMMKAILEKKPLDELLVILNRVWKADCHRLTMNNDKLLDKLSESPFDLAVVEGIFLNKCLYLVPYRLAIPFVTYTDAVNPVVSGVPSLPSFVPHTITTYSDKMTFIQRLRNTVISVFWAFATIVPDPSDEILNKYRQLYGGFDSLDDLSSRSLLWLSTRDEVTLDYPKPSMPNIINIGGLTAKPATGKLTPELDKFMSEAKKGVILVTFGSHVQYLDVSTANKFISVFQSLPDYCVIWRLNNRDNLTMPANVLIAKWLPQNDILADSRVKLFITHSGNNGQHEAIYHAVPMIGFPLMTDQMYNAARLRVRGYGIAMTLDDFTADQLLSNVLKIVDDPTYKQRTTHASKVFKSAFQTPAERACYWIEHVIEFGGDHLRSAGLDLNVFQYYMLDILAFIILLVIVVAVVFAFLLAYLVRCCRKYRTDSKKKTN